MSDFPDAAKSLALPSERLQIDRLFAGEPQVGEMMASVNSEHVFPCAVIKVGREDSP